MIKGLWERTTPEVGVIILYNYMNIYPNEVPPTRLRV